MRPGDFSPGNPETVTCSLSPVGCFNEAGGFLPRKLSMSEDSHLFKSSGFNEAGGFLPRKPTAPRRPRPVLRGCGFNEAGGFLPRKRR